MSNIKVRVGQQNAIRVTSSISGGTAFADNATNATNVIGGIASVTQLNVSGISTLGFATASQIYTTGIVTAIGGFIGNLTGIASTASFAATSYNLTNAANITTGTIDSARLSGTYNINISGSSSYATSAGIATYSTNSGVATYATNAGTSTSVIGGIASVTSLNVSGISTLGIVTSGNIFSTGIITANSFVKSGGQTGFLKADGSVDSSTYLTSYTETDTLNSVTTRGNSTSNGISVGILTASSGNFSGIVTSSGLRVTGVSTLGIVTSGNIFSTGIITATSFSGSGANLTGIVTSIIAGTNISISGSNGQVTINSTAIGGGSSLTVYDGYPNLIGVVTSIDFGANLSVTASSGIATVNAAGGGGTGVEIFDDSTDVGFAGTIKFGYGLSASNVVSGITTVDFILNSIGYATTATNVIGGIASVTSLNVSGLSTLGIVTAGNIYSTGVVTATSFVRSGGTSSQFLKADGTVDSSTYLTSYTETDTLNSVTTRGNSTSNGISVGILTASSGNFSGIVTSSSAVISGITTSNGFNATAGNDYKIGSISVLTSTTLGSGVTNSSLTSVGTLTNLSVGNINSTGILTASSGNFSGIVTSSGLRVTGVSTLGIVTAGNIYSTGVVTATSFSGNASSATALQNPKNFSITGNFVTAPAISFDGTGNVALAATISSKSIGLGTYTTGDYVKSISGTVNQITVTGGTGEGSTPTISIPSNPTLPGDVTIGNDLQVNNNLNVTGNITIGGTAAYIISNDFRVKDADIVLGYTTSITGADASTDTTANHGGIAIASTEGSPLVTLYNVSIGETNPATYKKIMWFKSGSFTGLNTDAWLINYAVGIGSTQFPSGTRLAAGNVQFTQNDLAVVRNINASGIVTATSFSGNATSASSAIYATNAGTSTSVIGGIASVTSLNVSGISTLGIVTSGNIFSTGVVTATSFVKSGGQTGFLKADGSVDSSTYLTTTGSGTNLTGIVTSITAGSGISVNQSTGNVTITATGGSGTNYWVSTAAGIHTLSNVGIGTTNPTTKLDVSGVIRSGRVDTGNEGGQVELARSTDNATAWYLDVFGNTSTPSFRIVDATAAAARLTIDSTGKITGDGSGLTGIIAAGSGVVVRDDGAPVGTAGTIDFGANLSVTFAAGIATVNSTAVGGGSSLTVYDGYPNTIGVVTSLDFSSGLLVSPVSSGIATVTQNLGMMVAATYNMLMP